MIRINIIRERTYTIIRGTLPSSHGARIACAEAAALFDL